MLSRLAPGFFIRRDKMNEQQTKRDDSMTLEVVKQVSMQRIIEKHARGEKVRIEELVHFIDYREMKICSRCGDLYGKFRYEPEIRSIFAGQSLVTIEQFCECRDRKNQELWERFDFNEIITLCFSCGQDLMMSGSRWAIWFCFECMNRVNNYNVEHPMYYIPIGRHSVMHGYKVTSSDVHDSKVVENFVDNVNDLNQRIQVLHGWKRKIVREKLNELGFSNDPYLVDYYVKARQKFMKKDSFIKLADFWGLEIDSIIRRNK
jgi:hypothetical protein